MARLARSRLPGSMVVLGDALRLPFADESFDRVLTGHFYGHLGHDERDAFLSEGSRVAAELVVVDAALRPELVPELWEERLLNDGSRHQIYKRYFTADQLADEIGGEVLLAGEWFVAARAPLPVRSGARPVRTISPAASAVRPTVAWVHPLDSSKTSYRAWNKGWTLPTFWAVCETCESKYRAGEDEDLVRVKAAAEADHVSDLDEDAHTPVPVFRRADRGGRRFQPPRTSGMQAAYRRARGRCAFCARVDLPAGEKANDRQSSEYGADARPVTPTPGCVALARQRTTTRSSSATRSAIVNWRPG